MTAHGLAAFRGRDEGALWATDCGWEGNRKRYVIGRSPFKKKKEKTNFFSHKVTATGVVDLGVVVERVWSIQTDNGRNQKHRSKLVLFHLLVCDLKFFLQLFLTARRCRHHIDEIVIRHWVGPCGTSKTSRNGCVISLRNRHFPSRFANHYSLLFFHPLPNRKKQNNHICQLWRQHA